MSQSEVNKAIQLALEAVAQYAAESGKSDAQIILDSGLLDDQTMVNALAFQAELGKE